MTVSMTRSLRTVLICGIAAVAAGPAFAHHNPMDGYDQNAPVVINGEINRIDWSGEFVKVRIAAKDGKSWSVLAAPPKTMRENGLDESAFGIRETVTIRAFQSKDKACKPDCLATGKDVSFAGGLKVILDGSHAKEQGKAVHDQLVKAKSAGHH